MTESYIPHCVCWGHLVAEQYDSAHLLLKNKRPAWTWASNEQSWCTQKNTVIWEISILDHPKSCGTEIPGSNSKPHSWQHGKWVQNKLFL